MPLVTAIFPGVMMPVPLENTPVRLVDPPTVIAVGLAVKLVIAGAEEVCPALKELHPARAVNNRHKANARNGRLVTRFKMPPAT